MVIVNVMVEKKLKQIAQKENGNYSINDYAISFTDGSRSPQSEYKIDFVYKDCRIYIIIQTGHVEFANIICELSSYIRPLDFKIDSTSPFENLFPRRSLYFFVFSICSKSKSNFSETLFLFPV